MFNSFEDNIPCNICGSPLQVAVMDTVKDYSLTFNIEAKDLNSHVDKLLNKYIVFSCASCGNKEKYTYKGIEREIRKSITKKLLRLILAKEFEYVNLIEVGPYVYCGKCRGFDGRGSCPKEILKKCEIKRFPNIEL